MIPVKDLPVLSKTHSSENLQGSYGDHLRFTDEFSGVAKEKTKDFTEVVEGELYPPKYVFNPYCHCLDSLNRKHFQ